jgi:hypothetical protein
MAETVDLVDNRLPVILCSEQFGIVAKDPGCILARESNRHPMFGQFTENIYCHLNWRHLFDKQFPPFCGCAVNSFCNRF